MSKDEQGYTAAWFYGEHTGLLGGMRQLTEYYHFSFSKISSFNLGAGSEPRNPDFACPKPGKALQAARLYPCTPTKFCHLDVQLFQIEPPWPRKSFDDGS
jgi:hypothetical protein